MLVFFRSHRFLNHWIRKSQWQVSIQPSLVLADLTAQIFQAHCLSAVPWKGVGGELSFLPGNCVSLHWQSLPFGVVNFSSDNYMQTQSKEVLMKEIIWTFALRSLENQIFTSGWLHPEWSEGNPVFCRGRPCFAWLSSSAVSACPLCLRRWLCNGSRGSDCGLGQFREVSGGRERGDLFFKFLRVAKRALGALSSSADL